MHVWFNTCLNTFVCVWAHAHAITNKTTNKTITNLMQYVLSQEESNLLKAGLYFSTQPNKIWKSEIFITFENIYHSFMTNRKSEETKSQIKAHLLYLANSYFYNYKPPCILCQHCILKNLRKNKDIIKKWNCHLRLKTLQ